MYTEQSPAQGSQHHGNSSPRYTTEEPEDRHLEASWMGEAFADSKAWEKVRKEQDMRARHQHSRTKCEVRASDQTAPRPSEVDQRVNEHAWSHSLWPAISWGLEGIFGMSSSHPLSYLPVIHASC